jgi:protein-S-isoprenylcysteine O-methyltransferase Ste14
MPPPADRAGVIAPPPFIYAAVFGTGYALDSAVPFPLLPDGLAAGLGSVLVAAGLVLLFAGARTLSRAGTAVNPYRPSTVLVTTGPYAYSRNPLYVAFALAYLGAAVLVDTGWPVMLSPVLLWLMYRGVIAREERYLQHLFGDEYRRYQARVRRWL